MSKAIKEQSENLAIASASQANKASGSRNNAELDEAKVGAAKSRISSIEGRIGSLESRLSPPPTMQVTESSGKGTKTKEVTDEKQVQRLQSQIGQLESEKVRMSNEMSDYDQKASMNSTEADKAQVQADNMMQRAALLASVKGDLKKLNDVAHGKDGFFNKDEETLFIKNLKQVATEARAWENKDMDKDGRQEGQLLADTIDAHLSKENGFESLERYYEVDYIKVGEEAPWKENQAAQESSINSVQETAEAASSAQYGDSYGSSDALKRLTT